MGEPLRFATFNILHGRSVADGRVDLERFADAVKSLDADVLALQEVDRDQPRSHLADFTEVAAQATGAVAHRFVAAVAGTPGATWMAATGSEQPGTATYGIALLSRYPVRSWQVLRLPAIPFRFPMWLPGPRKVLVVHEEPRAAVVAAVETPLGCITVANTHLSFVPGWNRLQLHRLRRDLAIFDDPLVLMGDLNLPSPVPAQITGYRPLSDGLTFPADAPDRQLDHILARGELPPVRDCSIRTLPLSDHRAVVVDV
ncbi:MAG TPA: endonuclease/exonuclease/phosphatase family protein [Jatrophihabitantaceae bacterium]|nr:endonuclease/exonuclease/phosphatase family protein [Jatrophihabitantaceae bacterium]